MTLKVEEHINNIFEDMFNRNDRILGVLCRGTDYFWYTKSQGKPNLNRLDTLIKKVRQVMDEYKCNKIFLATEDEDILSYFAEKIPQVFYIDDKRLSSNVHELLGERWKRENIDLKEKGLNYITNIYILTRCQCFIGAKTSASVFIPILSDMEYIFFYNMNEL